MSEPEPWLRGIREDFDPVRGHLLRSSEQIREDARRAAALVSAPGPNQAVAFHLKHLAGSTERLCAYAGGGELSAEQVAAAGREHEARESAEELLALVDAAFDRYELMVRATRPEEFGAVRYVGRKKLPVTLVGLLIHIAEHGQRHVGQAITAGKTGNG